MREVFGDKSGRNGMPPGMLAEFYWNFGWAGVLIGMFLMGVLFRQLFVIFASLPRTPTSVLIYTVIVTRLTIFSLGTDFGTGFLKAGLDLVPLFLMFFFFTFGVDQQEFAQPTVESEADGFGRGPTEARPAATVQVESIA